MSNVYFLFIVWIGVLKIEMIYVLYGESEGKIRYLCKIEVSIGSIYFCDIRE